MSRFDSYHPHHTNMFIPQIDNTGPNLVSPHDPNFLDHVDVGIRPIVHALNSKQYFTIDSCHGHWLGGDLPHVTFCLTRPAVYSSVYTKLNIVGVNIQLLPSWIQSEDEHAITTTLLHTTKRIWYVYVLFNPITFPVVKHVFKKRVNLLPPNQFY